MAVDNKICYVVGAMSLTPALRPYPTTGDFVIAADRGFDSLMAYGVRPDMAVGDFDSLGHVPDHNNVIELPVEKDDTDMTYALRKGLELGYKRFVMLGGVGGRMDHTLANLQLLDFLATRGAQGILAGEKLVATAVHNGSFTFPDSLTGPLAVFCNSGEAKGVTMTGVKYPLENATLSGAYPMGVSNEFTGEGGSITVEDGSLVLIWEEPKHFYTMLNKLWMV